MKSFLVVVYAASLVSSCCNGWIIVGSGGGGGSNRRRLASFPSWSTLASTSTTATATSTASNINKQKDDIFLMTFHELGFDQGEELQAVLENEGLWNNNSSHLLRTICHDYYTSQQADQLTRMLQNDFHLKPLQAHLVRSTLWKIYARQNLDAATHNAKPLEEHRFDTVNAKASSPLLLETSDGESSATTPVTNISRPIYKKVQLRSVRTDHSTYGLLSIGNQTETLVLRQELDQFWHEFMTRPNPYHPTSTPLRNATAKVYVTHATLFLGWYLQHCVNLAHTASRSNTYSLTTIFKDSSVESVSVLLDFVRWLRENRGIASSYEANVWRGLTKLLQFRYSQLEGKTATTLENLPALMQVRKWHREASKAAAKAPRRSQEDRKWLSWGEYLHVVKQCKQEFLDLEKDYLALVKHATTKTTTTTATTTADALITPVERKIAVALQRYLVLAIFATVPDRQRTIRELEINKSLVKDARTGLWSIKHSSNDYKTGKTYGERPSLQLHGLTDDIDLFIQHWRPVLQPFTNLLFVQPRTRKPLTQDSVYQIVGRACYQFTGQRTNPHLLRDMIVTHVRESTTTSEAELEALAMLMGHSVAVQRSSYDRRTLTQKVAPAVELMQQVNGQSVGVSFSAKAIS